jgi:predicted DNA-binding transcriptional regulator AlpA
MHPPELIEEIGKDLPTILYRTNPRFRELTGLSPRTMANLDSRGHGPAQRVKLGKTVGYPKEALLAWLSSRLKLENR